MAIEKVYQVTVDTIIENKSPKISFKQRDINTAKLQITVTQNNAVLDITGYTAKIAFAKADRNVVYQDATIKDAKKGIVEVVLSSQVLVLPRGVEGQVELKAADGSTITTNTFSFQVQKAIMSDDSLKSTNEAPMLEKAVEAGSKLVGIDLDTIVKNTTNVNNMKSEIEKARNAKGSLTERLDADKQYLESKFSAILDGSPDGVYAKLTDLQVAYPTGKSGTFVVDEDDNWYFWDSSSKKWKAGGIYQGSLSQETIDIRTDRFSKVFSSASEAVRALGEGKVPKQKTFNSIRDNSPKIYDSWATVTNGALKTTFDMAQVAHISSLNTFVELTKNPDGLRFQPAKLADFSVYVKITSATQATMRLGRLINLGASWGGLQAGQAKQYADYPTNQWVKVVFNQAELDAYKARTDYSAASSFFVVFDLSVFIGAGTFEVVAFDTRSNPRYGTNYDTFSFEAERAVRADNANNADFATKASTADSATTSNNTINAGVKTDATGITKSEGANATITYEGNGKLRIAYAVGVVSASIVYAREKLCKVADLKGRKVYVKTTNDNADTVNDISSKYVVGFSASDIHQWGLVRYSLSLPTFLNGYFVDGDAVYTNLKAGGALDTDQAYIQLSNSSSYTDQTPYSVNASMQAYLLAPDGVIAATSVGKYDEKAIAAMETKVNALSSTDYITAWGDSLTAGGGWTDTLATLSGLTVYNGGTGGENVRTITARQGGDVMLVNNITIPADTSEILIASKSVEGGIKTAFGYLATPLLQGGAHVNPCFIDGIEGTLRWTGKDYADNTGTWVWKRNVAGTAKTIKRPTALVTQFDKKYNNGIMVIFMGQNGGYTDNADLVNMHKLMIDHSNAREVVILGLSSGDATSRSDYETAMKKEFGRRFISLREYLSAPIKDGSGNIISSYGLDDAGITPTAQDLTDIAAGKTPTSLLSDGVHYTTACKTVIGNMLYKKMKELNILN